ncbi:hypothetical protein N7468_008635 [Penicillium chermesinum]|uniref:Only prolin and serin are matching in the corresponding protein n=1 Tax=Penicillium chermesinum TaxID=63820 RepID=A0A9W9NSC0_9EURO|nr:uncharacterized protein N7468_008635 [Penicillium chermesinum]KAJ5224093.1 hypothetical protein N7468_008635 [Penicillium chermesinum]
MHKLSHTDADAFDPLEPPTFTSAPASPAISLFSSHNRVSSSVSSLGLGNAMESPNRNHLSGVKEEPVRDSLEDQYFQHFDCEMPAEEPSFPMDTADGYDLTDTGMDIPMPENRRSDSMSMKGVSRIGSHISTMSTRWKPKRVSGSSPEREAYPDDLRSRANSVASSALASPERMSESGARPIDITRANSLRKDEEDDTQQATTPLLPPFMGDDPSFVVASRVQSPLQSPSVADVSVPGPFQCAMASDPRYGSSGDSVPFSLSDPNDEWANKLGHANFTIQPEPYTPAVYDLDSLRQLRADWDMARCNFARHLVRTGEHYGTTSNIYKLTGEKWDSVNEQWRLQHESLLNYLGAIDGIALTLTQSNIHPCEEVRIPRLHDNAKFPEMGDEDIVGPMTVVAPTELGSCRPKEKKRNNFFKFFHDLVSRP